MRRLLLSLCPLLLLAASAPGAPAAEPSAASRALAAVLDEHWQHRLETEAPLRLRRGLPVHELPDLSFAAAQREADFARALLGRLAAVDPRGLDHEEGLSLAILRWELERAVEAPERFWHFFQVTPYVWTFTGVNDVLARHQFAAADDLARYLRLLGQVPGRIDQLRANLATQRGKGILLPKEELELVVPLFRSLVRPPAEGPFAVVPARLAGLDAAALPAFRAAVERLVVEQVNPALERLLADLGPDYHAAAPDRVGLGQYPGGDAVYRWLVRYHTTLDLTPEEVHQRGLAEVERLNGRMAEVRRKLGFTGTKAEFHQKLRSDPRFFAKTPEEVGERLMRPVRAVEPLVPRFFLRTPKAPYGVSRLDPRLEGSLTFGYYQMPTLEAPKGLYFYNGSRLDERPLVNAAALMLHELVPGHHFQIALQAENDALPPSRREAGYTAYVEGWGEYASELGLEMGVYEDPYDLYGRLGMDMFLSTRLVVDTGMHALGWSRQRAADFMLEHALETPAQVHTETLRYAVDLPGQALAYKTGSTALKALRAKAEQALGPGFDVRRFHDAVLGSGSMPLEILEKHVDWWIAEEKARR